MSSVAEKAVRRFKDCKLIPGLFQIKKNTHIKYHWRIFLFWSHADNFCIRIARMASEKKKYSLSSKEYYLILETDAPQSKLISIFAHFEWCKS